MNENLCIELPSAVMESVCSSPSGQEHRGIPEYTKEVKTPKKFRLQRNSGDIYCTFRDNLMI